jgi:hypothetical protein
MYSNNVCNVFGIFFREVLGYERFCPEPDPHVKQFLLNFCWNIFLPKYVPQIIHEPDSIVKLDFYIIYCIYLLQKS